MFWYWSHSSLTAGALVYTAKRHSLPVDQVIAIATVGLEARMVDIVARLT